MQIKVEVKASFPSGATVELTGEQVSKVSGFVTEMLFGAPVKEKRAYRKRGSKHTWTPEEEQQVREAMQLRLGIPRNRAYKALAFKLKRTRSAISQKATEIRALDKEPRKLVVKGYQPISSLLG